MRRNIFCIVALCTLILAFVACHTDARYRVNRVTIDMTILDISAGYIRVTAETNKDAYYVMGVLPADLSEYDPYNKPNQFMNLMLDSLYRHYLDWRYSYLKQGIDYVASFESHCLHYDSTEVYFRDLTPDTDYWLYSFPVNPYSKSPSGDLCIQPFSTCAVRHHNLHFDASVNGYFVFIYPRDDHENVLDNTPPFYFELLDSAQLAAENGQAVDSATLSHTAAVICQRYREYPDLYSENHTIARYSYRDDPYTPLLEGHTYYLLVAVMDGSLVNRTIFRFTFSGPDYQNDCPHLFFREGPPCPLSH